MEQFFSYLGEHPELIASAILFVVSIITLIVKRRPKTLDEFLMILDQCLTEVPVWVSKVEEPGNGDVKKAAVLSMAEKYMVSILGRELSDREDLKVYERVSAAIEEVLEAPTKKGSK